MWVDTVIVRSGAGKLTYKCLKNAKKTPNSGLLHSLSLFWNVSAKLQLKLQLTKCLLLAPESSLKSCVTWVFSSFFSLPSFPFKNLELASIKGALYTCLAVVTTSRAVSLCGGASPRQAVCAHERAWEFWHLLLGESVQLHRSWAQSPETTLHCGHWPEVQTLTRALTSWLHRLKGSACGYWKNSLVTWSLDVWRSRHRSPVTPGRWRQMPEVSVLLWNEGLVYYTWSLSVFTLWTVSFGAQFLIFMKSIWFLSWLLLLVLYLKKHLPHPGSWRFSLVLLSIP